jgi:hypothetical protein
MKLNWGTKIALLYGIFILIVLSMVFVFMTKDVDLVSNKYYDDGINYQEKINDMKRSESLSDPVRFFVSDSLLIVQFPKIMEAGTISGALILYRPSDLKKDIKMALKLNSGNQMIVNLSGLERGLWKVKTQWTSRYDSYYNEEIINIQ